MITKSPSSFNSSLVFVAAAVCMVVAASAGREMPPYEDYVLMDDHVWTSNEIARMAGYGEEKLSTVLITGTLLCTSCSSSHPHRLHQSLRPVSGALVAATCNTNSPNKKPTWEKGVTDDNGEFIIDLPSQLHAIPELHKACSIEVLWLPKDSPCHSSSSTFEEKERVNDIVLSSVGNGIRTYTAGTIQFVQNESENAQACKRVSMEAKQDTLW